MDYRRILVTGSSGFIGFHLCKSLLENGYQVFGIDNMNDYYDVNLKEQRLRLLKRFQNFNFKKLDITNMQKLREVFQSFNAETVINLAAQAGVRYSLENPNTYINSNILGFMNVLECSRIFKIKKLLYASSSSVYGKNENAEFSESDVLKTPLSIYSVSKITNELMAYSYNHLYDINSIGLRFFTAYGPWGRPDMAIYIFSSKILKDEPIPLFNNGNMYRDFTYVTDIICGIRSAMETDANYDIFNLGSGRSIYLMDIVSIIEKYFNKKAKKRFLPINQGDPKKTLANIKKSQTVLSYNPSTAIKDGVYNFLDWFVKYKGA
tara:strand:+ start:128 stop:1090 length:963 start_codon:yes stop_codon:yes gene_type:complete